MRIHPAFSRHALAVASVLSLLSAGSVHAESNVTLYGIIDENVSHYSAGGSSGASNDTRVNDGTVNGMNGSRWGIKTTEDLGNGLKANVLAEAGLAADTGALGQGGLAFGRQIYVGLSSDTYGEFRAGRQYLLVDGVLFQMAPFGNALTLHPGTGITNKGVSLPYFLYAPRVNNALQYRSPSFSGFSAQVQVAPAESSDRFLSFGGVYQNSKTYVGFSYEWNDPKGGTEDKTNESLSVAANYNFGSFKILGGLQRNRHLATGAGNGAFIGTSLKISTDTTFTANASDAYTLGVEVPYGAWKFGLNYSNVKYKGDDGADATLGKAALGASYNFSKLTLVYASASLSTGDLKDYIAEKNVVQLGLRKAF
jgi:general bacterial porin, GBP family